jgi:hypothetical protein
VIIVFAEPRDGHDVRASPRESLVRSEPPPRSVYVCIQCERSPNREPQGHRMIAHQCTF